jgi:glucose-6-phosphate 1-dehydrogenase
MDSDNIGHNRLILRIQPNEGIVMNFGMKKPGEGFHIENVSMDFHYSKLTSEPLPEAYERLLLDVLNGDPTLYARNDAVEACWRYISPILNLWSTDNKIGLYGYNSGTWGPEEANSLFENKNQSWHNPCPNISNDGKNCEL